VFSVLGSPKKLEKENTGFPSSLYLLSEEKRLRHR